MQTLAVVFLRAAGAALRMHIAVDAPPLCTASEVERACVAAKLGASDLRKLLAAQVGLLDSKGLVAEIRDYKEPPSPVRKVLLALLCLV